MRQSQPWMTTFRTLPAIAATALSLLGAGCGAISTSATSAPVASTPQTTAGATASTNPPPHASAYTAVTAFGNAYARYLDGRQQAHALPATTPAAQAEAGTPLPPSARKGSLTVASVQPLNSSYKFLINLQDRVRSVAVQVVLTLAGSQWQITQIVPPNIADVVPPPASPVASPHTSAAVRSSARAFLHGYLAWLYGHAPATAITRATPSLIRRLKHNPPRIPPTFLSLHGHTAALDVRPAAADTWKAVAAVTDSQNTYNLALSLAQRNGRWLVTSVRAPH